MMQRRRREKTVDGRDRQAGLCKQPAPAVGHGKVNRKHPPLESCMKIVLKPEAQFFTPFLVRQRLDPLADLTERHDAYKKRFTGDIIKP